MWLSSLFLRNETHCRGSYELCPQPDKIWLKSLEKLVSADEDSFLRLQNMVVIEGNHFFGFGQKPIGFAKPKPKPKPTIQNQIKLVFLRMDEMRGFISPSSQHTHTASKVLASQYWRKELDISQT